MELVLAQEMAHAPFLLLVLLFGLVGLLTAAFWVWMIVEVATKEPSEGDEKLVWLLIVLLVGPLGGAIYFFARRPRRIADHGR